MRLILVLPVLLSTNVGGQDLRPSVAPAPAPYIVPPYQSVFNYTHLFATADGRTDVAECTARTFPLSSYSGAGWTQAECYQVTLANATSVTFIQMPVDEYTPAHTPPASQFVTVSTGSWYILTGAHGTERVFEAGDIMFQDNTADNPGAAMTPTHISGTVGDEPCNLIVTQVEYAATVDVPCPF